MAPSCIGHLRGNSVNRLCHRPRNASERIGISPQFHARMRAVAAAREAAWRATFEPHAYLVTERTRPTQITIRLQTAA